MAGVIEDDLCRGGLCRPADCLRPFTQRVADPVGMGTHIRLRCTTNQLIAANCSRWADPRRRHRQRKRIGRMIEARLLFQSIARYSPEPATKLIESCLCLVQLELETVVDVLV